MLFKHLSKKNKKQLLHNEPYRGSIARLKESSFGTLCVQNFDGAGQGSCGSPLADLWLTLLIRIRSFNYVNQGAALQIGANFLK